MAPQQPAVGENIAIARKAQGYTQPALARRAGISISMMSKIEVGDRVASPAVVSALAKALQTTTSALYRGGVDPSGPDLGEVRVAVRCYDLPGDPAGITMADLQERVQHASNLRAETRYVELVELLPALITDATAHAHAADDPAAWSLMNDALGAAHATAYRLGHRDFAEIIAARQEWTASRTWNPVAQAVAAGNHASVHQAAGDYTRAVAVVESAVSRLSSANLDTPEAVIVRGTLHLRGVAMAALAEDANTVTMHLRHAHTLAERMGAQDRSAHNLVFGPGNAVLHELGAHVELDRPDEAVDLIADFVPGPGLTPTRIGHLHIDAARAHLALGDRDKAQTELQKGEQAAPEMVSVHPMAREVARVLVSSHRRSRPDLIDLAGRLGVVM